MIGCLRTYVRKQPIIALYFESENATIATITDQEMQQLQTTDQPTAP